MDRLDKEILKAILTEEQSIYEIRENIKGSNYATVWRHIKKMRKEGLLTFSDAQRKNGKPDKRKTMLPKLTNKGIATLLIDGDLQKEELFRIGRRVFLKTYKKIPISAEPFFTDIFSDSLLELKPKVNLKYFDEEWFLEISRDAWRKSAVKAVKKYQAKFEKEGIWATEKELRESDFFWECCKDTIERGIKSGELKRWDNNGSEF